MSGGVRIDNFGHEELEAVYNAVNLEAAGTAQSGYKGPSIYATKSGKTDKLGDLPEQVGPTQQYESIEVTWENGLAPIKCTWDANTNKLETENMPLTTVLDNLGI